MALPFTFKSGLKQKMNCGNSNISPCKNIVLKKSSIRNQNPSSYCNSRTNLRFQHKPKYHQPWRKEREKREERERRKKERNVQVSSNKRERERERGCVCVCVWRDCVGSMSMTVEETVLSLPDLPVQLLRCHKIAVAAKAAAAAAQCCRPQTPLISYLY
jgi:hypothetical protein